MTAIAVVPAAGAAERFGSAKLLTNVGGRPMLERTVASLLDAGIGRVVVVLGPEAKAIRDGVPILADSRVRVVTNRHPERGMISSIQAGVREAGGDPLVVLPGDMPYVEPATIGELLRRNEEADAIVSPRFDGKRGHPVVIPARHGDEILAAAEDETLHDVLRRHAGERIDVDVRDRGVVRDVDTPGDLEAAP